MTNWSQLQDGLGTAEAVPELLSQLASSKQRDRLHAFNQLEDERLVHQGRRFPAAVAAIPLLFEALDAKKHPGKPLVLRLLATIAVGAPELYARGGGVGEPPWSALRDDPALEGECFRAVAAGADRYEALLRHRSAPVRASAAVPLAFVDPSRCIRVLVATLAKEATEDVALSWLLALAVAARLSGEHPTISVTAVDLSNSPALQAGAAIVRAYAGMGPDEAALAAALGEPLALRETPFGRLGDVAIGAVLALGATGTPLLQGALESASPTRKGLLAQALIRTVLPDAGMMKPWAPLRPARAFQPAVLDVLRFVVRSSPEPTWGPLSLLPSVGITRSLPDLKRFLGIDPPGPLEKLMAWRGGEVEAVLVIEALALGAAAEDEARAALLAAFPPAERVPLALAMADHVYELHFRGPDWTPEYAVTFAASLLDDESCLSVLEAHAANFDSIGGYGRMVLVIATHRLRRRVGAPFLPDLARVLQDLNLVLVHWARGKEVDYVREVLADAPAEVRDSFALQVPLIDRVGRVEKIMGRVVPTAYAGWNVLDLASDRSAAARRGVEAVASWTPLPESDFRQRPVEAAQRALRALLPEVRTAFETVKATATPYGREVLEPVVTRS